MKSPNNIMKVCVEEIIAGRSLLIKFSSQASIGQPYFQMFIDWLEVVRSVDCLLKRKILAPLPLIPVFIEGPFRKRGLDFIAEINPPSSGHFKWIFIVIDYFTKWVEKIPAKKVNEQVVMNFLEENIFGRFRCPIKIVTNNSQVFNSSRFINLFQTYNVILSHSTMHHPQLAESSSTLR